MGQSYLCGCPEAAVPGEVVAVGAASLLLAAGADEDTEGSGDRAPGCRSRAVRMRHGAGDGGLLLLGAEAEAELHLVILLRNRRSSGGSRSSSHRAARLSSA
jgi:hypothetical protein